MYPPITCLCGRPLGHIYRAFQLMCAKHLAKTPDAPIASILDQLHLSRDCCRARIMTCAEFKDYYNRYNPNNIAPTISGGKVHSVK